jgi:anhydro-N-acetylmuramic acid kinase
MVYKVIGLMSGSSLDGLDIAFVELEERSGKWSYAFLQTSCYAYDAAWTHDLSEATHLSARDYLLLDTRYGHYLGQLVNRFIEEHALHFQVHLIVSHGHTVFHAPAEKMTSQLGSGAAIAAETGIHVVNDLRALDVALGGQGAPIVPIAEKLLLNEYDLFLNLGGIANISFNGQQYIAFDVCPCNRVLNALAADAGKAYDEDGKMAASGTIHEELLNELNELEYYSKTYPKSLDNSFGIEVILPLIRKKNISTTDVLRTYTEHIALQVRQAVTNQQKNTKRQLLVTGGGAFNSFLVSRIEALLNPLNIEVVLPSEDLINYKEALAMALMGVLRWRQERNVLSSVTGSSRDSIGGALWMGQEA